MNAQILAQQFSPDIAESQKAPELCRLATDFTKLLIASELSKEIVGAGFSFLSAVDFDGFVVKAHDVTLHARRSQIWILKEDQKRSLAGQFLFRVLLDDGQYGPPFYRMVFDHFGNASLKDSSSFSYNMKRDSDDFKRLVLSLSHELIKTIHKQLDVLAPSSNDLHSSE